MSSLYTIPFSADGAQASCDHALRCFIGDDQNSLLQRVLQCDIEGLTSYSPMTLVGPSGCGKTRLGQALANRLADEDSILKLTGSDFYREQRAAEQTNGLVDWTFSLDRAAVLFLDDLHQLGDHPSAIEQFASTLDRRQKKGLPTIVVCRVDAWSGDRRFHRVLSRLASGLMIQVRQPGTEARKEIIRRLSQKHHLDLTDDVAQRLSEQLPASLPQINQFLVDLKCRWDAAGRDSDRLDLETLARLFQPNREHTDKFARLALKLVAAEFGFSVPTITSRSRRQMLVQARSVAVLLMREVVGIGLQEIARHIGRSDHSTVIHSLRKIKIGINDDPLLLRRVESLRIEMVRQMQKICPLVATAS